MIQIPIEIGDTILAGRFKNKKIKVNEISVDEYGNPTVNGRSILKIRIPKLYQKQENEMKTSIKEGKQNETDVQNAVDNVSNWVRSNKLNTFRSISVLSDELKNKGVLRGFTLTQTPNSGNGYVISMKNDTTGVTVYIANGITSAKKYDISKKTGTTSFYICANYENNMKESKQLKEALSPDKLKTIDKKIAWGTEKELPFSQGFAIKDVIKRYNIPAIQWGYVGTGTFIGVETKKQKMFWRDKGSTLEFLGILNKDGSVAENTTLSETSSLSIGDSGIITDKNSMYKGKQGTIVSTVGKDWQVAILVNGTEKNVVVSKNGLQKSNGLKEAKAVFVKDKNLPSVLKDSGLSFAEYKEYEDSLLSKQVPELRKLQGLVSKQQDKLRKDNPDPNKWPEHIKRADKQLRFRDMMLMVAVDHVAFSENVGLKEAVNPFQKSPLEVKIKQIGGSWHIYLQTVDGEECLTMSGWDTKENAEHAAMMKGYSFDGNKSNETPKRDQPKYTGYEKVRSEKPEEMKLSKEKKIEIKLERMIREILGKKKVLNEQYTKNDLKFVDGKALVKKGNKILAKVFDREAYFKAQNVNVSFSPKYPYSLTINAMTRECESLDEVLTYLNKYLNESALVEAAGTRKLKKQIEDFIYTKLGKRPYKGQIRFKGNVLVIDNSEISFGNYASWIAKNATGLKWEPIGQSMAKLVESVLIESNLTDNIKTQLRTLKDLQQKIAEAKAQVDAIIKSTGLKDLEKSADKLLKEELWDFFNELKRDEQRLVDLGDIIMTVTKFQSEPATYEYEKTLDYALTQVNQDVKEKVLMQLKATEKIGKTKGSVSFATKTESVGSDIWNKVTSFLGKFLPAIKRKGQKIDSEISKLKSLINKK
jgi:hypothetical protein